MDYNDFKEFFKVHVKQYGPYKDSKMFQLFSNFLMDSYYKDSYDAIPNNFKSAFENQVLTNEYVKPFLMSLGLPISIIDKISNQDRFKIINLIGDFHRYKGTIKLVDNLITTFDINDNMAAYELYVDMRVNFAGDKVWEVLPKLIKSGSSFQQSLELNSPELFALLDSAPNWLIDEYTLGSLYDAGELILPYKTNCILLDSTILNNIEPLTQIISELVIGTFRNDKIQLFFKDGTYLSTIENFNDIWYYIFRKIYNKGSTVSQSWPKSFDSGEIFNRYVIPNLDGTVSRGGSNSLSGPLSNIQSLIDGYAQLSTSSSTGGVDIANFYASYIDIFSSSAISHNMTAVEYRTSTVASVGVELVDYIDNRLTSAMNIKSEANAIMSELYNSILTFKSISQSDFNMDYFDYYFLNLPGLVKDIKNSTTYMLLNFLKPYHSDLIDRRATKTVSNSKFNNALVSYSKVFSLQFSRTTNAIVADHDTTKSSTSHVDQSAIFDAPLYNAVYSSFIDPTGKFNIGHTIIRSQNSKFASSAVLSDLLQLAYISFHISGDVEISNALKDIASIYPGFPNDAYAPTLDRSSMRSKVSKNSTAYGSDGICKIIFAAIANENILISDALRVLSLNRLNPRNDTLSVANDRIVAGSKLENLENLILSDLPVVGFKSSNSDTIPMTDIVTSYVYDNPVTGNHIVYTS